MQENRYQRVQVKIISFFILFFACIPIFAEDFDARTVHKAMERVKEYEKKIILPDINNSMAQKAAKEAAHQFYAPDFQQKITAEIERLKIEQFSDILTGGKEAEQKKAKSALLASERLYIFISSSMLISTLRAYAFSSDRLNDPNISMIMRGFVKGMKTFGPTLEFVENIVVKDTSCDAFTEDCEFLNAPINIDPLVFRKYGIKRVPAVCYVRGIELKDSAMSEGDPENLKGAQDAYIVYGDLSFARALEVINKETKSIRLSNLIRKLRGGFYAD